MKTLLIHLLKAFTQNPTEGNPAGVLLDADGLTDAQMVKVAADLGFSESAFVFPSEKADFCGCAGQSEGGRVHGWV